MISLIMVISLLSGQIKIEKICSGNSYMLLGDSKEYESRCDRFLVIDEFVFDIDHPVRNIIDDSSIAQ
jgi:hypothetical protein